MGERYLLKVQGSNARPCKAKLYGFSASGISISEIANIPVLSSDEVYQYYTVNSYDAMSITPYGSNDIMSLKVTFETVETPMYRTEPPCKSTLTEQDKEALKVMIREVVTEVVNEALDERERRADEAKRRGFWEI